jgi:ABC-type dipeptide/oligopeptide/nickel transport system ATPase subunit
MLHIPYIEIPGMALRELSDTQQPHRRLQLIFHDIDEMLNPFLTVGQCVEKRSTHAYGFRTETQRFYYVGAAPDATVEVDFYMRKDFWVVASDFEEG